jgi:hypothetical protein
MGGQRVVYYLIQKLRVKELRRGDMVVFVGEVLEGISFLIRGQMHVADGAMWPEAINRRAKCSGVRFNLATSAHAALPHAHNILELDGNNVQDSTSAEGVRSRGSPLATQEAAEGRERGEVGGAQAAVAAVAGGNRRPPRLAPEQVMALADGYGGHREGGWEAIAGAGSSWGERSVAPLVYKYVSVVDEVLRITRARAQKEEEERRMRGRELSQGEDRSELVAQAGVENVDEPHAVPSTAASADVEALAVRERALPFGHVYDALLACGCVAASPVRKAVLGEEFGELAGVPAEDRSGGAGNIGLRVTVVAASNVPQLRVEDGNKANSFCKVEWEDKNAQTCVAADSWAPTWNEVFDMPFNSKHDSYEAVLADEAYSNLGALSATLWQWNRFAENQVMGKVSIPPRTLHTVLKFGVPVEGAYPLETEEHDLVQGSQEVYRGRQINLRPTTLTLLLSPLYKQDDPRVRGQPELVSEDVCEEGPVHEYEDVCDNVTEQDLRRMVTLLPREEEPEANFSMHAHSHATVYSLDLSVVRDMCVRFPQVLLPKQ